jgi:HprK-related kinase A
MQTLNRLTELELAERLRSGQLHFQVGPYTYRVTSNLPQIAEGVRALYSDFLLAEPDNFDDFNVAISRGGLLSRMRGQADFLFDHQRPFGSIPASQAYAFMEWGMNWCVSLHANEYLKLHAAAVARDGIVIIMPGVPGAGKSTLCAAMGLTGWRILSDEHALIQSGTTDVIPLCRPVSLKNESIEVIRSFDPGAIFGPVSKDTHKGTVAHMKADLATDSHDSGPLPARIMLFPKYSKEEPQRLSLRRRTTSFILAAYHSFNYSLMGEAGFQAMKRLIEGVDCYDLVYRDLDWALQAIDDLHTRSGSP